MKTIVTHLSPDLDAVTAAWLVMTYFPDWKEATLKYVPSGTTLDGIDVDNDKNIIHVDTGFGQFDHHQTDDFTSASKKVFNYLRSQYDIDEKTEAALSRIVNYVTEIDHFHEVYYPDADDDRYDFGLQQLLEALKHRLKNDDELIKAFFPMLSALVYYFKRKIEAEKDITKGYIFRTTFGKALALETQNGESARLAQKKGFALVVTKDPVKGYIRIKTLPDKHFDLTPAYDKIKKKDSKGTWFLHASRAMLLNGSSTHPTFIPTSLTLKEVIEILQKI